MISPGNVEGKQGQRNADVVMNSDSLELKNIGRRTLLKTKARAHRRPITGCFEL